MYLAQFHDVRHVESLLYMYIHMITHVYVDVVFPFVSHSSFPKKYLIGSSAMTTILQARNAPTN